MDKIKLLSYGYLFKELPPVFNSIELGTKYNSLIVPTFTTNKCIEFSIPKGQYARRGLQLPHPLNYIQIVNHLTTPSNWAILKNHFAKSNFSHSKVKENPKAGTKVLNEKNRATQTNYVSFSASKRKALLENYDMLYELKIDISKYYPSIYTHSIVWAVLGKERAKELWKLKSAKVSEPDFPIYDFADKLDNIIRFCQDNQSVGIPIGPDTSHIIAEIIGSYIDIQLSAKFPEIKAFRYFDDYLIYIESEDKAQIVLRHLQQVLAELQLSLNESKLKIQKFPFEFEESWVKDINDVTFVKVNEKSIKEYFSTLFGIVNKNPDKSNTIFNYSLRTFEKRTTEIDEKNWELFEALLLKSILIEPSIIESAARIFETYKTFVSKEKIKIVLLKLLNVHCELNHHYETVWSLWIFKQLQMYFPVKFAEKIINTNDNFSILLLLDLNKSSLIDNGGLSSVHIQNISDLLELQNNTDWFLYYEAVVVKKWIVASTRTGFNELKNAGISFYDTNAKIKIFDKR